MAVCSVSRFPHRRSVLLRPDAQFLDTAVNRYERIFPRGTEWLTFRSQLPGQEVFANSVLDPAIGIAGDLGMALDGHERGG